MLLPREEYVEQAYFFQTLRDRMQEGMATQDLLAAARQEVLATTQLPFAIDFMASELRMTGGFATAMARIPHYFTSFQTFVVTEAEKAEGKFDFRVALEILQKEAEYRATDPPRQGAFVFQFESICRNRLGYDRGLEAMAYDEIYDEAWREWILTVRRQIGIVDLSDLIYVRSAMYVKEKGIEEKPTLFGEKEGRIAFANRLKDPLYLFAALQRHLGFPAVPRPKPEDAQKFILPQILQRIDRLETRISLMEEEQRGGINISRYFASPDSPPKPE